MHLSEAWRLLELSAAPTVEQVKAAYRRLAKQLHPDLSRAERRAAEPARFARLTLAYEMALAEAVAANRHGPRPAAKRDAVRATPIHRTPTRRRAEEGEPIVASRATPGSTTYPAEPYEGDPEWDGAGWVGASSGTYWTVNPKEYADPRRHGPEYRARGRRPVHRPAGRRGEQAASAPFPTDERQTHRQSDRERPGLITRIAARIAAILRRQGTINE